MKIPSAIILIFFLISCKSQQQEMDNVSIYSSYKLNNNERQLFLEYYDLLPLKHKETIAEKVIGIYFVNNFLGGGMTLPIFDNNGNMYIALFFNPEILSKSLSEWINFRDNSAFTNNLQPR